MQADFKINSLGGRPVGPVTSSPTAEAPRQGVATSEGEGGKGSPAAQQAAAQVDPQQLESAVRRLSDYVQQVQRSLQFSVDNESGRTVITVIDAATEEVIRQIPSEEALAMAQALDLGEVNILEAKA